MSSSSTFATSANNKVSWLVIPKGQKGRKLSFTVMATFDQGRFVARGPFAIDNSCNGNWCTWIRQSLESFSVSGSSGWKSDVKVKRISEAADKVWDAVFEKTSESLRPTLDILANVPARAGELLSDPTSIAVTVSDAIALYSVALHLSAQESEQELGWIEAPTIDHLFSKGPAVAASLGLTESKLNQVRQAYTDLADIFLPVSPNLEQQNKARYAQKKMSSLSTDDHAGQLLQHITNVYSPVYPARISDVDQPIFTAETSELFMTAIKCLAPVGEKNLNTLQAKNNDSWKLSAVKHMVSTVPYVPTVEQQKEANSAEKNAQNRLAALMAEPGILGSLGLLFDLEIEIETLDEEIWVSPVWKEGKSPSFESCSPRTAVDRGYPKFSGNVNAFDAAGFLKLGLGAEKAPQFMLSDFRFDEALRQALHRAQSERNLSPQYSPGTNYKMQPTIELVDFQSHDLALHWLQRPDLAAARRQKGGTAEACPVLYLEDLISGIRPLLGRVSSDDRITWFDLTRKDVEYGVLGTTRRSEYDRARDGAIVPLTTFDKRIQNIASVAELLFTWNGWGIGLRMPGVSDDNSQLNERSPFEKAEKAYPHSLPPFRYGDRVCMAARLVLRDGSCLIDYDAAKNDHLPLSWKAGNELVIGNTDSKQPFRLHRWERLRAPLVLLDDLPRKDQWWPPDSSSRVILATSLGSGKQNRSKAIRFIVPARETDMFSTWKHGMFDGTIQPTESAFPDIAVDKKERESFFYTETEDGKISLFKPRGISGPRRKSPYHPDPMVTHVVVTLVRRRHAKSDQYLPIEDSKGNIISVRAAIYGKNKWPDARALRVEIVAVNRNRRKPAMELSRSDSALVVRVPEGESFSLLVFSDGDQEVLSRQHAFGESRLAEALNREGYKEIAKRICSFKKKNGRYLTTNLPFLSNATVVDVEHLLDRPYFRPRLQLKKNADRKENETRQPYQATIEFDPGSTSAVEIYGSWIDPEGDVSKVLEGKSHHHFPRLVWTIEHDAMRKEFLGSKGSLPLIRKEQTIAFEIEDETNDCKHRKIAYWARGVSNSANWRNGDSKQDQEHAHPKQIDGHNEAMQQLSYVDATNVIHVHASRRPAPINYRYLVPAFRFSTEKTDNQIRRLRSSVCALHMDGSWFSSGADEKLAVVLIDPSETKRGLLETPQQLFERLQKRYAQIATFWGADPLRHAEGAQSRLPDFVAPTHFSVGTRMERYTWRATPEDEGVPVVLALLEPEVCADENSWRVPIPLINPSAVSRPFVRFAFARYQPFAVENLGMSEILLADYAQLSNDREVVVVRDTKNSRQFHVTVYGVSFDGTEDSGEARLICWLERRCARQIDGEAAWIEEGMVGEPWKRTVREGRACWHGSLTAEESFRNNQYRVAIAEEERYRMDTSSLENGIIPVYFDLIPVAHIS